ncbi:winged helix-turn-helix transcriptional regulator [Streptomyces rubiginosohelvolus]|uniref:winged helix-turn-helix transcriptional regulator n=1 Tax=Streptomyces rubiginosohelvolus TaxID=67362 RepID=UPI0035DA6614
MNAGCCLARLVMDRIGERWTMLACQEIAAGSRRFGDLKSALDGVSNKVLSETLVRLERDGLIERRVFDSRPPTVQYEMTPMGTSLLEVVRGIVDWSAQHGPYIEEARRSYENLELSAVG